MKKIRRRTRNKIIGVGSSLVIILMGVILVSGLSGASDKVQMDLLGQEAHKYGIVSNSLAQWYHVDTNFATKEYSYVNGGFDFRVSQYTDGIDEPVIATKVINELRATRYDPTGENKPATIWTADNPKDAKKFGYDDATGKFDGGKMVVEQKDANTLNGKIDSMIGHVRKRSLALAGTLSEEGKDYKIEGGGNYEDGKYAKVTILTTDPVVYIDASKFIQKKDVYSGLWNNGVDVNDTDDIVVERKSKDQTIVFNFAVYKDKKSSNNVQSGNAGSAAEENKAEEKKEEAPVVDETEAPATEEPATEEPAPAAEEDKEEAPAAEEAAPAAEEDKEEAPAAEEDKDKAEEENKDEADDPEKSVDIFGNATVARAADEAREIDVAASEKLALQIHQVKFAGEATPNQAPSSYADKLNTINVCESVIYNIPYGKQFWFDEVFGTIAATNSDVKFGGSVHWETNHATCCGWLVANHITTNCGEWHQVKITKEETTTPPTETPVTTTTPPTETPVTTTTPPTETPVTTTTPPTETPVTTTTPPTETPVTTTTPPTETPVVTTAPPTETPLDVVEEDVPKTPASPEPEEEVEDDDVPLSDVPTKPSDKTETIIEQKVPLSETVPETGDSMNPMIPVAGMGISLLAILGVVVIRKKKQQ